MDWENQLENSNEKIEKNSINRRQIAAREQKITIEKAIFCLKTVLLNLKTRAAKSLAFSLHFLFQRDQNHHSKMTSMMKM